MRVRWLLYLLLLASPSMGLEHSGSFEIRLTITAFDVCLRELKRGEYCTRYPDEDDEDEPTEGTDYNTADQPFEVVREGNYILIQAK